MTAPARDESTTTALAVTKDDIAALSPEERAAIAKRKAANVVAAQMAGTNWGKGLDQQTQRAVADWGQRHGIDVTTEIHVLGGNIYLNAQFYINRLVELVTRGRVLDFRQRFVNVDARLEDTLREVLPATASDDERREIAAAQSAARREIRERRELRILHQIPDNATAAVVTDVTLVALPHTPFVGVKWAPRHESDPIGAKFPQETALTRSARRALKLCVRHLPEVATYVESAEDDAVATVKAIRETAPAFEVAAADEQKAISAGPFTVEQAAAAGRGIPEPEHVGTARASSAPLSADAIARAAAAPDPYQPPASVEGSTPPTSTDLFGGESVPEPAAPAELEDDPIDDSDIVQADERAAAAKPNKRK